MSEDNYLNKINCKDIQGNAYLLMYNYTIIPIDIFDPNLLEIIKPNVLAVKLAIDNAIINYYGSKKGYKEIIIELITQSFPVPLIRFIKGIDVVSINGPLYFFIPPMLIFGLLMSEIVREKEQKLRNGLSVIGVSATAFWIS